MAPFLLSFCICKTKSDERPTEHAPPAPQAKKALIEMQSAVKGDTVRQLRETQCVARSQRLLRIFNTHSLPSAAHPPGLRPPAASPPRLAARPVKTPAPAPAAFCAGAHYFPCLCCAEKS